MKLFAGPLNKIFLPRFQSTEINMDKYLSDLHSGAFNDKFNLGISAQSKNFVLKDFFNEPNALFVGTMGSGKSVSARFSLVTWMLANSHKTEMFFIDVVKGAQDYKALFKYPQVHEVTTGGDGVIKVLDLMFDEALSRNTLFKKEGAANLTAYEKKTGKTMTRYVVVMEEFHAIPFAVLNFDKEFKIEGTPAQKFHTLMRIGRSIGIWFVACSQRSLSSDVPKEMVANFTQKQIFRVSKGESNYVLGNDSAATLRTTQAGRCFTEAGEVQFPFMQEASIERLLAKYMKPLDSESAQLIPSVIKDYLEGRSTKELYRHKKMADLVRSFENLQGELITSMILEALNFKVEEVDSSMDENGISHIITKNGRRTAVMVKNQKKITGKHLNRLISGIINHKCSYGLMITAAEGFSGPIYKTAKSNMIELLDKEDLISWAVKIDNTKNKEELDIDVDRLANDFKEDGTYQGQKGDDDDDFIEDESLFEKLVQEDATNKQDEVAVLHGIPENKNLVDELFQLDIDNVIDKALENRPELRQDVQPDDRSTDLADLLYSENEPSENDDKSDEQKGIHESLQLYTPNLDGAKKIKRPTLNMSFNMSPESNPSFLIHCLRNEEQEVYRVLMYVILENKIKHRFFIDKKVKGEFAFLDKKKLGITDTSEWNSQPIVASEEDFKNMINKYLENFNVCENKVYTMCWDKDISFYNYYIAPNTTKLRDTPTNLNTYLKEIFGSDQSREELIQALNLKIDKTDLFEQIEYDFQLWLNS